MNKQILCSILATGLIAGTCSGLEKEPSLVTGEKVGNLAVAGKLLIDMHSEFMMNRTFETFPLHKKTHHGGTETRRRGSRKSDNSNILFDYLGD
jgi:hypothetical protein